MEIPKYLQILWSYKWLLAVGLIVAVGAGFLAGFTITDGQVVSRVDKTYTASTTVLVGSSSSPLFQAEIPGQTVTEGTTAPVKQDLPSTAVVYAYLIAGNDIRTQVEATMGPLADDETITAVRRTTQPSGNEAFPGRLTLPILDVIGTSSDPARAELISTTANDAFQSYVVAQQDAQKIPAGERVDLTTIKVGSAVEGEGSNPNIPIIVTGLGVFLIFVAFAFVLYNAKLSRQKKRAEKNPPLPEDPTGRAGAHALTPESELQALEESEGSHDDDREPALAGDGRSS